MSKLICNRKLKATTLNLIKNDCPLQCNKQHCDVCQFRDDNSERTQTKAVTERIILLTLNKLVWCSQPKLLFTNQNPNGSLEISKSTMDYTTVNQVLLPRSGEGKGLPMNKEYE